MAKTKLRVKDRPKTGHVRFLPLDKLLPARLNDQVYRPVDANDPEVQALAASIREHGIKEPLVVTLDRVILSGHRRRVAAKLAGLDQVPVLVEPIRSEDPSFGRLLVECNRQRVKGIDEVVREEVVLADPEEAHRRLVEHRQRNADINVETLDIIGEKTRSRITDAKKPMLQAILSIIEDRRRYWPLTDRQVHYGLLNDPPLIHASKTKVYANDLQSYKNLTDLLTRARLTGLISWSAISDLTRPMLTWKVHRSVGPYVREQVDGFLKGFYRDLQQSQPRHIEIVAEKMTVQNIVKPVAGEFCIPLTIGRGYCSLPPRYQMAQRFKKSGREKLVVLILSDFDPEGEDIADSFCTSMRDDFGIATIQAIKVALTSDQVSDLGLPPQMKAKKGSSRRARFVERHGDDVFEMEAVVPDEMQTMLKEAIVSVMDVEAYNAEIEREKQDAAKLDAIREQTQQMMVKMRIGK